MNEEYLRNGINYDYIPDEMETRNYFIKWLKLEVRNCYKKRPFSLREAKEFLLDYLDKKRFFKSINIDKSLSERQFINNKIEINKILK